MSTFGILRSAVHEYYDGPGPLTETRDVVVPRGGLAEVAGALVRAGVIAHAIPFEAAALLTGAQPLHAAEFRIPAFASVHTVLDILRAGRAAEHQVSIPEGLTAAQIALLLDRTEALSGEDPMPSEGAVMPATYNFPRGATRASIVQRASLAMRRDLAEAWANRAPGLPLQTPEQALVLASIVERETARPDERPLVAAVFLNRLRLGMPLQSDPTVAYAASGGLGVLGRKLTRDDLEQDNPYNTYRVRGLPPGPIDSPGVASLQAVTHPATTDMLYFVADGTGGHAFARSLDEHRQNVARWRGMTNSLSK